MSKVKKALDKVRSSAPQILATALSAAAATAYVLYLKDASEKNERFKPGENTVITLGHDDIVLMTEEGAYPAFNIQGHQFEVHYEPVDY